MMMVNSTYINGRIVTSFSHKSIFTIYFFNSTSHNPIFFNPPLKTFFLHIQFYQKS